MSRLLLSAGGTHPSTLVEVQSIGIDAAMTIGMRANLTKWTATATYPDAAAGLVVAAVELYGVGSTQAYQVPYSS